MKAEGSGGAARPLLRSVGHESPAVVRWVTAGWMYPRCVHPAPDLPGNAGWCGRVAEGGIPPTPVMPTGAGFDSRTPTGAGRENEVRTGRPPYRPCSDHTLKGKTMDGLTLGCGVALVVGAIVLIGLYGGPSQPRLVLAPPERVELAPHTPDEAPENDYTGSLASVVYAGHRKAVQAVSGALKSVRRYFGRHRVIERHRVERWSIFASRRGAWWPRDQRTLVRLGNQPRHLRSAA